MSRKCENVHPPHSGPFTMPRPVLDEESIHPAVRAKINGWQHAIVDEVKAAVQSNDVVVVGIGVVPSVAACLDLLVEAQRSADTPVDFMQRLRRLLGLQTRPVTKP